MGVPDSALQLKHTEWKNIIWKNCVHHRLEFQRLEEPMELWSCYGVRYWSNTLLGHRMLFFSPIVTFYINWNSVGTEGRIIRNIHLWNNYWINKNSDLISKIIATFYDSSREWERLRKPSNTKDISLKTKAVSLTMVRGETSVNCESGSDSTSVEK